MEEETEIVVSSSCGRKESRIKKMIISKDHLPQGKKIREAPGSMAMMSDGWWRTKIPSCTERNVFVAGDCYRKGKCAEITVNAELTQEKCQDDVCIKAKKSGSKNACGGLSDKKANKRKVAGMYETNRVRIAKTVTEDAQELFGYWSSCHNSRKSTVRPVVKETGPESQKPVATLVDEVTHRFSRLNTGGTSECGRRLADLDLNELLTELKAFKDEAQEDGPDEPGLVLIKFV